MFTLHLDMKVRGASMSTQCFEGGDKGDVEGSQCAMPTSRDCIVIADCEAWKQLTFPTALVVRNRNHPRGIIKP